MFVGNDGYKVEEEYYLSSSNGWKNQGGE